MSKTSKYNNVSQRFAVCKRSEKICLIEEAVDNNNLKVSNLPNFNLIIGSEQSKQGVIQKLQKISSCSKKTIFIDVFSAEMYKDPKTYVSSKHDFIVQAIRNEVPFEIVFGTEILKRKINLYGFPSENIKTFKTKQTTNTLMFISVLKELITIIENEKILVLRDIYYKNVSIYDYHQKNFDIMLNKITKFSGIKRSDFNVIAAQKGQYYTFSDLTVRSLKNVTLPSLLIKSGKNLIPTCFNNNIEDYDFLLGTNVPTKVLIVEKDAVLADIAANINPKLSKTWIFVSGKGQPDLLTKNFIRMLYNSKSIKEIYILTDLDPYGIYISLNYMTSIFDLKQHISSNSKSEVFYAGIKCIDLIMENNLNVDENIWAVETKKFLQFRSKDYKIAANAVIKITKCKYFNEKKSIKELLHETQRQMFFGFKAEVNILKNGNCSNWIKFNLLQNC
ncbi:hypothetical protein QEN19_000111 [Hanseniaspora menglaensis]